MRHNRNKSGRIERLTDTVHNYKIALLADLHGKFNCNIIPALSTRKPDMICIAGDLINTSLNTTPKVKSFLTSCVQIACTYFSLENHDFLIFKADIEQIKSSGVHVLNDEFEDFNSEVFVDGMTSYFYHKYEKYDPKYDGEVFDNMLIVSRG